MTKTATKETPYNHLSHTPSGIEVPVSVTPEMAGKIALGEPGQFPFTRGIFESGYRGRLWTIRQYSGFGTAESTNERYRFLLDRGQTGLSVALDLPTQCGYDPSDEIAMPEIGKVGVSLSNLAEAEILFDQIDLSKISTSFTINGTAAIIYAMYLAVADKKGIPRAQLTGTIQNDILKEYVARGTWIFPVRPSMRLIADSVLFANEQTPRFNPISIAGAHVRDAGCTAAEEMAYTLANGLAYVDEFKQRGGDINKFAKRLSFFFYVHMDLFEEVAKFRAGRRMWAKMLSERYGVTDEKALQFRFGVVCGGAQSIFTCAFDEAYQIPTETSAEIALRTQQIVAEESGIARTVDPLGGSYYVEWLTDQMEEKIGQIMDELDEYGGVVKAIEDGYLQAKVAERAKERKQATDSGARPVVGVNVGRRDKNESDKGEMFSQDPETVTQVLDKHARVMDRRDQAAVDKALAALRAAAATDTENVMPHLVDCCHAYVTVGEMVATLKKEWGEFQEPIRF